MVEKKHKTFFCELIKTINSFFMILLALTIFLSVIARYAFQYSIPEFTILQKFSIVWLVFLGTAVGVREDEHLKIDIFSDYLPERAVKLKTIIIDIILLFTIIFLVFVGYDSFKVGFLRKELIPIRFISQRISLIYYNSAFLVGALLMLVFQIRNLKDKYFSKGKEVN